MAEKEEKPPELEWVQVYEARTMGVNFLEEGKTEYISVGSRGICIARTGNKLYAVANRCPHNGGPLHQGHLEGDLIVCPWHRFRFCLKDGKHESGEGYYLETYPLEIREDGLFIGVPKRKKWFGLF